ncbi:LysE family translocator [Pseudomonas mosselii]|uniref:LysE family translocator n=1 Tax=Pseudomonas mosselii TaxID=78327 RepID=UPI0007704EF6|nr:LysE family translocator [Pseudomonas mosselii]AMK31327.1 Threonine efflux protein [Pseudomonas putida]ATB67688.1 LysE family translocator [Pseudomonas mosselii]UVN42183.1 LysE family translocator [Pseudomonas mosselii]
MQLFLLIATAHFLALLSPGPDFFLVARTSASAGWRVASGACVGIALANGVFIGAAFAGVSFLRDGSPLFVALQLAGCGYLLYIGQLFLRHAGKSGLTGAAAHASSHAGSWLNSLGMGFASGILNPKNALFYASLASMIASSSALAKLAYGIWMFAIVLAWDLLVAVAIGNQRVLHRFARALPWLERTSGVMLILLASGVLMHLALG